MNPDLKFSRSMLARSLHLAIACVLSVLAIASTTSALAAEKEGTFATATDAVQAFIDALRADDDAALLAILGKDASNLIDTGDPVQDRTIRANFVRLFDQKHVLDTTVKDRAILIVGDEAWPFPIPIVKSAGGWAFNIKEGMEEILNRRIGRNELSTIQTCLAMVDAEHEYYLKDHDGDGILEYAQKFMSSPGKQDGLYWPTGPGEEQSPLGDIVAGATAQGYAKSATGEPVPYQGYYFKILTSQGKNAPGGAYDYASRGNMFGGFAILAYPSAYGGSGIMTFMVNQDGIVYQRNLGKETASKAKAISSFNPGANWQKVPPADLTPTPPES